MAASSDRHRASQRTQALPRRGALHSTTQQPRRQRGRTYRCSPSTGKGIRKTLVRADKARATGKPGRSTRTPQTSIRCGSVELWGMLIALRVRRPNRAVADLNGRAASRPQQRISSPIPGVCAAPNGGFTRPHAHSSAISPTPCSLPGPPASAALPERPPASDACRSQLHREWDA